MRYALIVAFALAGCASTPQQTSLDAVLGLQTAYDTAVTAEIVYEKSGRANPSVLSTVEAVRLQAYSDLEPIVVSAESGGDPATAADMAIASAAIAALQSTETANSIKAPGV